MVFFMQVTRLTVGTGQKQYDLAFGRHKEQAAEPLATRASCPPEFVICSGICSGRAADVLHLFWHAFAARVGLTTINKH